MTALEKFRRLYPWEYDQYQRYAKRLRFSDSLLENAAATVLRSIHYGDGALWSDSLLVTCLNSKDSSLRCIFDRFPGFRSSLLAKTEFKATLSTGRLSIMPEFQSSLSEELHWNVRRFGGTLTEERVLEIELQWAVFDYRDANEDLAEFVTKLSRPILDLAGWLPKDREAERVALVRMHHLLEDVVVLSLFARRHPFSALSRASPDDVLLENSSFVRLKYRSIAHNPAIADNFIRARKTFYWQLRDAAHLGPKDLSDSELERISEAFRYAEFSDICETLDGNETEEETVGSDGDAISHELREQFLYAAARLWTSDLPVSLLADRLSSWREHGVDHLWPISQKLVLSAGEARIEASLLDLTTPLQLQGNVSDLTRELANIGIWAPSPTWSDSVLERLEHMIERGDIEQAFQSLFEAYPEFILDDLHVEAFPQLVLFQAEGSRTLRPDFAVRRRRSAFIDIVEIKRPNCKLVVGSPERPRLTQEAQTAISQLKEYREYFRDGGNRKWIRQEYGLDGFEPRLTLVIGRQNPPIDPVVWAKATSGAEVEIVTYDQIAEVARARRRWMP